MKRVYYVVFLTLFLSGCDKLVTYNGIILDSSSRPVEKAMIVEISDPSQHYALTQKDGRFYFKNVNGFGSYDFIITKPGYIPIKTKINVGKEIDTIVLKTDLHYYP